MSPIKFEIVNLIVPAKERSAIIFFFEIPLTLLITLLQKKCVKFYYANVSINTYTL